jgi:hypothetical protein
VSRRIPPRSSIDTIPAQIGSRRGRSANGSATALHEKVSPVDHHGSHDFDFLHGEWTVEHRRLDARLCGCRSWTTSGGIAICRAVLAGAGNVDEITVPVVDDVGLTLRLYDPGSRRWTLHWASRRSPRLEPPMVGCFDGGIGRFFGDDEHEGIPIRITFVWDEITPTSARWQQAFSIDGGETWETNWVMRFQRRHVTDGEPPGSAPR